MSALIGWLVLVIGAVWLVRVGNRHRRRQEAAQASRRTEQIDAIVRRECSDLDGEYARLVRRQTP